MEKNKKDLLEWLSSHHHQLRRSMAILKDSSQSPRDRRHHVLYFLEILKAHNQAEEETLYSCMMDLDRLRVEAQEGEEEHAIASRLSRELEELLQTEPWSTKIAAKATILAELVEMHMAREESIFFPDMRSEFIPRELTELGLDYKEKFEKVLAHAPKPHVASNGLDLPTHFQ